MRAPAFLVERGFSLRWVRDRDFTWLRDLYGTTRADELAPVPWTALEKRQFLDKQFELQHNHFVQYFGVADFLVIENAARKPVGRYYVSRDNPFHVVDIALMPQFYGRGIGTALLQQTIAEAEQLGRAVLLHVNKVNQKAMALYSRLGFEVTEDGGSHWQMRHSVRTSHAV